jgi:hypothetical protein
VIFEYKVRARHRLGWEEFSFYATTEIEEFLNRNSIEYVRNATDTVEHRLFNEIERLNKIIEIKNNRIQQLMKRTRSARIDKATKYIDSREWENCEECMNIVYDILKGDEEE